MHISVKAAFLAVIISANMAFAGLAHAQTNLSVQQTINALTPHGSISATNRGIKPLTGTPSTPSTAPSVNLSINFLTGSAALTPQAMGALDRLGTALTSKQLASYSFKIAGHTDTVGAAVTNQTLSEQRADAVKSYLETKFGIPADRLQATGLGETDLLVATPPQTPNQLNRRVEIINIGQ